MHKKLSDHPHHPGDDTFDLEDLLHPAQAFGHPMEVVHDPDLTLNEKRAILASWASDSCAVEAAPELRRAAAGASPVRFDDVMDALRNLDQLANDRDGARYRRLLRRRRLSYRSPDSSQSRSSLN